VLKDTQHLILIILGIITITCIITKTEAGYVVATVLGILGGFLTGKKIYVDQETQTITEVEGEEIADQ